MATLAPQADKFNDTMAELGMAGKVASMSIINDMLPAMTRIAAAMAQAAHESGSVKAAWVGFGGIGWEAVFKPFTALVLGATNSMDELILKIQKFIGAPQQLIAERAGMIEARTKAIADLQDPAAPGAPKKEFDARAWTKKYKEMMAALGLERDKSDKELRRLLDADRKGMLAGIQAQLDANDEFYKATAALAAENNKHNAKLRDEDLKGLVAMAEAKVQADFEQTAQIAKDEIAADEKVEAARKKLDEERLRRARARRGRNRPGCSAMPLMRVFERGDGWARNFRDHTGEHVQRRWCCGDHFDGAESDYWNGWHGHDRG